jgi:hypothetical protein
MVAFVLAGQFQQAQKVPSGASVLILAMEQTCRADPLIRAPFCLMAWAILNAQRQNVVVEVDAVMSASRRLRWEAYCMGVLGW